MKWIQHDTDANQDAKLQNVLLDYGLEGYGLYWYCIELIAGKVDKDNITFELEHDARIIARNTGSTPQKVEEMMRYLVKEGLFESSEGVITCFKLAKRLTQSMTSNPQMRAIIDGFKNHDPVMTESQNVMQDKITLDKNKECNTKSPKADRAPSINYEEIKDYYNEMMPHKKIRQMTDKRKRLVKKLFDKAGIDIDTLKAFIDHISQSPDWAWTRENNTGANGVNYGARPFEYYMTEDNLVKAMED